MKASTWIKVAMLIVIGICSSLVTSSIIVHNRKLFAQNQTSPPIAMEKLAKVKASGGQRNARLAAGKDAYERAVIARFHLDEMTVTTQPGRIAVAAKATMHDWKANQRSYMWRLLVRDESFKNIFVDINYDNQIFSLPLGEVKTLSFNDTIRLSPGKYQVELRLHRVDANSDLNALKNVGVPHPDIELAGVKLISVSE